MPSEPRERPFDSTNEIALLASDTSSALIGAIVGTALGGPVGTIVGGAVTPSLTRASMAITLALNRRRERAALALSEAASALPSEIDISTVLDDRPDDAEIMIDLLRSAARASDSLIPAYASLIHSLLSNDTSKYRLQILAGAINELNEVHLIVLRKLGNNGGELPAQELSVAVAIPEIELRSIVRDLELRGMIKDCYTDPMTWKLRELGEGIVKILGETSED